MLDSLEILFALSARGESKERREETKVNRSAISRYVRRWEV